jgi:hypothetical protein
MVSCLEQHNALQLTDAVPSIVEVLNMNCTVLKSLNINSLIQIGYYVLQEANLQHNETNEYISTLAALLLNSAANENKEERAMKENFLFAVWCRTGTYIYIYILIFISSLCINLDTIQNGTLQCKVKT